MFGFEPQWDAITSFINPTDIQIIDDSKIYATTNGGIVEFNKKLGSFDKIGLQEGILPLNLGSIYVQDNLFFLMDYQGSIQVYNSNSGFIDKIVHLDFIDKITDLNKVDDKIFTIGHQSTKDVLLKFSFFDKLS